MNRNHVKMAALGTVLLALASCATGIGKEYAGPALPGDQTALVEAGPYTHIESMDGNAVMTLRVSVLPGTHTMVVRPAEAEQPPSAYLFYSRGPGSVRFAAEAGHGYLVYVEFLTAPKKEGEDVKGSGFVWVGHVLDKSTGKKVAETDLLPLEAEPRAWPTAIPRPDIRVP